MTALRRLLLGSLPAVAGAVAMLGCLVPVGLASASYAIAAEGSLPRGLLAAVPTFLVSLVAGLLLAQKLAIAIAVRHVMTELRIGSRVLDALPGGGTETQSQAADAAAGDRTGLSGFRLEDLERMISEAAGRVFDRLPQVGVFRWAQGLGRRGGRLVSRLTFHVIRQRCAAALSEDGRIDLAAIRRQLTGRIDGYLADELTSTVRRLVLLGVVAETLTLLCFSFGVRSLPSSWFDGGVF